MARGYNTTLGEFKDSGLDDDWELGLNLIRSLAKKPSFILINAHLQSFGRSYVETLERLIKYGKNELGIIISADSNVLKKFADQEINIDIKKENELLK